MVLISELVAVENLVSPTKSSRGREEKMEIVQNGMQSILNVLYRCQDEWS